MDMMDMTGMGDGPNGALTLAQAKTTYWAFVGAALGVAVVVNILNQIVNRQRLRAVSHGTPQPAKPIGFLPTALATTTAIAREVGYARVTFKIIRRYRLQSPVLGHTVIVLLDLTLVLALSFYGLDPQDEWQWEQIAYRIGHVATAQLPLIFVLAGKNNIIGGIVGCGYERLNWLHRWTARILLLTVSLHMAFWFEDWARYDYIKVKLTTDSRAKTGFAAWCILLWMVLSSLAPLRRWNYEIFVVQHVLSIGGITAAIYLHLPQYLRVWLWISVAFAVFDRVLRSAIVIYFNLSLFHPKTKSGAGLWTCKATLEPVECDATRITIHNPPMHWKAGQHVFLSCHSVVPLQSHPFTISSLPKDGKMVFLVKSRKGGTKKFFSYSQTRSVLPVTRTDATTNRSQQIAIIEGPYGQTRSMRQFDSVIFFAGSTGITFTLPLMRDIVASWLQNSSGQAQPGGAPRPSPAPVVTRCIRFVWVIKSRKQLSWYSTQLTEAVDDVTRLRSEGHEVELEISIYTTCDEELEMVDTNSGAGAVATEVKRVSSERDVSEKLAAAQVTVTDLKLRRGPGASTVQTCGPNGSCCCTNIVEDEDEQSDSVVKCECRCEKLEKEIKEKDVDQDSRHQSLTATQRSPDKFQIMTSSTSDESAVLRIFSGRPHPRSIIRKVLEQALGESGVVVCGPEGLVDDVRASVVALSDERAIHKGTGAQGVYLHTEAFGY